VAHAKLLVRLEAAIELPVSSCDDGRLEAEVQIDNVMLSVGVPFWARYMLAAVILQDVAGVKQ
jgi:hypothetical protein